MRCNHCDDAPCVTICPTTALFRRDDGIVDFDDSGCIGCKSCMNACPYDALYINPATQTAHKCNFCAHRVEVGLEPSCVIVCPTQSIVAGDLDDPTSRITRDARPPRHARAGARAGHAAASVFYKGADEAALDPLRTSDRRRRDDLGGHRPRPPDAARRAAGPTASRWSPARPTRPPHPDAVEGHGLGLPGDEGGQRRRLLFAGALAVLAGHADERALVGICRCPLVALVFAALTGVLLIADLKQPRALPLHLHRGRNGGRGSSRGACILLAYGAVVGSLWLLGGLLDSPGLIQVVAAAGGRCSPPRPPATRRSCSASARAATSGRRRCCCRCCWPRPSLPAAPSACCSSPALRRARRPARRMRWAAARRGRRAGVPARHRS